jgi:homospermidine synthase
MKFEGKFLFMGFGSITSGTLPLLCKHINIPASRVQILAATTSYETCAQSFGVKDIQMILTEENRQSNGTFEWRFSRQFIRRYFIIRFNQNLSIRWCTLSGHLH